MMSKDDTIYKRHTWLPELHNRNVDLCYLVSTGSTYAAVARMHDLTRPRVGQIYRAFMARLCAQKFGVSPNEAALHSKMVQTPRCVAHDSQLLRTTQ